MKIQLQLPLFPQVDVPQWLCAVQPEEPAAQPEDPVLFDEMADPIDMEPANLLDALNLNPLLTDVSADATGVMSFPEWSAMFATNNLLDHLGGMGDDNLAQRLYDAICRARLEFTLLTAPNRKIPFFHHTETTDLRLMLVVRDEVRPPVAILGLTEDF